MEEGRSRLGWAAVLSFVALTLGIVFVVHQSTVEGDPLEQSLSTPAAIVQSRESPRGDNDKVGSEARAVSRDGTQSLMARENADLGAPHPRSVPPPIVVAAATRRKIPQATIDQHRTHRAARSQPRRPPLSGSRPASMALFQTAVQRHFTKLASNAHPKRTPGAMPKWALEMGRNLPRVEDAGTDKKVFVYIVNRSFNWLFMSLGNKLYNNIPDRSTVRQLAFIGQKWNVVDKKLRKLQGFTVDTMHKFTIEWGNQLITIEPDGVHDKDVPAMPFLTTVLNNTGFKPVLHYVARPQWAKEMGRWVPPIKAPAKDNMVHFYIVNHSPFRWWCTLGDKRYNSVPPRSTARQVAYVGQTWSFTDRKKQTLGLFSVRVHENVVVTHANQAITVPPRKLKFSGEPAHHT